MGIYITRRILQMVVVLIIVSIIVFLAVRLLPGDPVLMHITQQELEEITQEQIDALRHDLGLDRPLIVQYGDWLAGVVTGDFGTSIIDHRPVMDKIKERVPVTLHLGGVAFVISAVIGIFFGVIAAVRRGSLLDNAVTSLGNMGITIPVFWLGILLMYLFGLKLELLPVFGYTSPFKDLWASTQQAILPIFCLAVPRIASVVRLTRSSMLEVIQADYIRTAWSKGLREQRVIITHALKNALIPVITLTGMQLAAIIGGQVLIETVFSIPGMGRLMVEGVLSQDYPVVQGVMLVAGTVVLAVNLFIDLSWGWLDPRIRYG